MRGSNAHSEQGQAAGYAAGWVSLFLCVPLLAYRAILLLKPLPLQDFITYWAAGRLFVTGGEPYSPDALIAMERSLGWPHAVPVVMLNPPWVLALVGPLALMPFVTAHAVWFAVSLGIEILCSLALWDYFGGAKRQRWIALVVLATFLPAATAEHYGQITPLLLGAMTVLLFALRGRRYVLAGACLAALGLKPHLLYLVLLAILLWSAGSVRERRWVVPVSAAAFAAGATLAAIGFNRNVLGYFRGTVPAALISPCGLGGFLRSMFGVEHVWLQFVPCVVGIAWFAAYWMRHRRAWVWEERLPLLLLVSIGSAAYFWKHDYILGLPAVIALAIEVARARVWPVATVCYVGVQLVILSADATVKECALSLLWIVLYVVIGWVCARRGVGLAVEHAGKKAIAMES